MKTDVLENVSGSCWLHQFWERRRSNWYIYWLIRLVLCSFHYAFHLLRFYYMEYQG